MPEKKGAPAVLTLDAAGEFAAGANVLAAYWPKDVPHRVILRTPAAGRRELVIPLQAGVIDRALGVLAEWAKVQSGVSASAKLLQKRIRAEAAKVTLATTA